MTRIRPTGAIIAVSAVSLVLTMAAGCAGKPLVQSGGPTVVMLGDPAASDNYRQTAVRAAAALLATVAAPAGAKASAGEPAGTKPGMSGASYGLSRSDQVESTKWWTVDGSPVTLEAWMAADLAKMFPGDESSGNAVLGNGILETDKMESLNTMSLYLEELEATVGPLSGGRSVLRVDAVVSFRPVRTAAENIANIQSLTVTTLAEGPFSSQSALPSSVPTILPSPVMTILPTPVPSAVPGVPLGAAPESVTVTGQGEISAMAALFNAQPASPEISPCPADLGGGLELVFQPADPAAAEIVAQIGRTGCRGTSVEVRGVDQPTLSGPLVSQVLSILGVHWNLTSTSPSSQQG